MLKMSAENIVQIGFLVVLLGFALIVLGGFVKSKEKKIDWAFGGFIGPFVFGFASREDWLKFIIIVSIIFLFIFVFLNRKLLGV